METTTMLGRPSELLPVGLPACWAPPSYVADPFRTQGLSVFGTGLNVSAAAGKVGPAGQPQTQLRHLIQDQSTELTNGMVGASRGRPSGGVPPRGRPD